MKSIWSQLRIHAGALVVLLGPVGAGAAPDDVEPPPQEAQLMNLAQFHMDEANFDANVFQPSGNAKQARHQIEAKLKLQLDELGRICSLNDAQKQKLKLAASSDVKRFFDEVAVVRKKAAAVKNDQNAWNNIWQEIQPLQAKQSAGLFGDASFFAKTIRKTLSDEQNAKYTAVQIERRRFRYRASIEVAMTTIENAVALRHTQREEVVKMLLDETQPPLSFGQHDQHVVMYRLARLPETKLKSLLDERQWQQLQIQFNNYRGMEQFLIQNGLILKEDGEAKVLKLP